LVNIEKNPQKRSKFQHLIKSELLLRYRHTDVQLSLSHQQ